MGREGRGGMMDSRESSVVLLLRRWWRLLPYATQDYFIWLGVLAGLCVGSMWVMWTVSWGVWLVWG
jgi:hypothetical protein